jgi:hypothetical protein
VLCPGEIAVYRPGRGKASAVAVARADGAPAWGGAVKALAGWLARSASPAMRLHIVLSNHFARFACVPWSEVIANEAEFQAVAALVLENCYGGMGGWAVSLDSGAWGEPRLACAVENALLAELSGVLKAARVHCPRIEPYFVTCWNRWCAELPGGDALLVVAEPQGPAVVAALRGGAWHSVRPTGAGHKAASLRQLLNREALLHGFEGVPGYWLHSPGLAPGCAELAGSPVRVLAAQKRKSSVAMTMALVGGGQ